MAQTPDAPSGPAVDDERRRRRQRRVVGGLLLTFAGLLFSSLLLPTDPAALVRALPLAAAGLLLLWVGGIALGLSRGEARRGR